MPSLLAERTAYFWLSPAGKDALKGIVERESFRALVKATDEHGVWVVLAAKEASMHQATGSVLLLKWEYLATTQVELPRAQDLGTQSERVQ